MKSAFPLARVDVFRRELQFKSPARTSRDTLLSKPSWFLCVETSDGRTAWGECSLIPGLSPDKASDVEAFFDALKASNVLSLESVPMHLPAVRMAVEMVIRSLHTENPVGYFPGAFTRGERALEMNGLIWMDEPDGMMVQAKKLLDQGFNTLKMKVGSRPFELEVGWLRELREEAGTSVTLRCDANGAFSRAEPRWTPMRKLEALAALAFHSIEQPLQPEDTSALGQLCLDSPLPIALDESLIGVHGSLQPTLLERIRPQFLVLKPSLIGGFEQAQHWVSHAEAMGMGWWVTSALESNLGLYAIAQWVSDGVETSQPLLPQGLGTGGLFTNNVAGSMEVQRGHLVNRLEENWSSLAQFFAS